jgi:hypothetical protein
MTLVQWMVAAGTSAFVALIGYFQYRAAKQKFALDLFDRRHETFSVVRQTVAKITSHGTIDALAESRLGDEIEKAYFFFGDDVVRYLRRLQDDIITVNMNTAELDGITDAAERKSIIERNRAAKDRIFAFYKDGQPLFGEYMRFKERVPRTAFAILRNRT